MFPPATPAFDLSRPRLREVSHWIRDELDPLVAREGPGQLRADDLLTLHDIFQALKTSSITALDLRATGIHRAVTEIAGKATRWPGRLADDCDRLVYLWTAKFGRLTDLHPFLYGRGGRLEGIASIEESSKPALLNRWETTCPEKISPKRARRRGNLGFQPGSWWINPLFACHAGIIDVDTVDGGICHDKHGAYAILVVQGDEIESLTESTLTYRCGTQYRGRFRLTAATPKSREPIRLLRSHSVNSRWGPKAGVRYEGMYRVKGWAMHQLNKLSTGTSQKSQLPELVFDIHLERCDPTPMDEVVKIPTAGDLDDYSEFKRLRKIDRDSHHRGIAASDEASKTVPTSVQTAPTIALSKVPMSLETTPWTTSSPAVSHTSVMTESPTLARSQVLSSKKGTAPDSLGRISDEEVPDMQKRPTLSRKEVPYTRPRPNHSSILEGEDMASTASPSKIHQTLKEVAPWFDLELPSFPAAPTTDFNILGVQSSRKDILQNQLEVSTSRRRDLSRKESHDQSPASSHLSPEDTRLSEESEKHNKKKERRTSLRIRSKNLMSEMLDSRNAGPIKTVDFFFSRRARAISMSSTELSASSKQLTTAKSMTLDMDPKSERRDPLAYLQSHAVSPTTSVVDSETNDFPSDQIGDTLVEQSPAHIMSSPPNMLEVSIEAANTHTPKSSLNATQISASCDISPCNDRTTRTRSTDQFDTAVKYSEEEQSQVAFRDPFDMSHQGCKEMSTGSSNPSPGTVL